MVSSTGINPGTAGVIGSGVTRDSRTDGATQQ